MTINSENILFFFGAGASAEFGIPTMTNMAKDFRLEIEDHGSQDEKCLYNEIIETLSQDMESNVDIEAIFSVIDGLKEYNRALVGELALYMIRRVFGRSLGDSNPIDLSTLDSLESRFRQFVRTSCRLKSDHREKMSKTYTEFFNTIGKHTNSHYTSSNKQVKYDNRWTLFTTNYDRYLEAFWREDMDVDLDTGFIKKDNSFSSANAILNADYFLNTFGGSLQFQKTGHTKLRLVKLHGSITWLKKRNVNEIEETGYDIDLGRNYHGTGSRYSDEIVIYPLKEKRLYLDPYIQMLYCLNKELQDKRVWIVVGYSFRDQVIGNIFTAALDKYEDKKMILVSPDAKALIKDRFPKLCHKRIFPIEKYFGKQEDLSAISSSLEEELKLL